MTGFFFLLVVVVQISFYLNSGRGFFFRSMFEDNHSHQLFFRRLFTLSNSFTYDILNALYIMLFDTF